MALPSVASDTSGKPQTVLVCEGLFLSLYKLGLLGVYES